jgi:proteasome accessory factor C
VTGRAPAARTSASDRVTRLLAIVPWIAAQDGPTVDEVCVRFGLTRPKLLEDLGILSFVGIPPYTPDTLIDVTIEGDRVWLRFADVFARPLHLTPEQGLALVAAGSASQGLPGSDPDGPLATALGKLAGVLGVDPSEAVSVTLGDSRPAVLDALRTAAAEGRRVRLDYYSYGRDERTTRDVDPHAVYADRGAWYLAGYCHLAEDTRLFRVERVVDAVVLDETFDPPETVADEAPGSGFALGPAVPRVTLEVGPAARWVVETYPVDEVSEVGDGRLRIRLAVAATPWLERLLVRLGGEARVVEADDPAFFTAGRAAAERILARYERPRPEGSAGTADRGGSR